MEELVRRYPECESRLRDYLQDRQRVDQHYGADATGRKRPEFVDLKSFGHYSVQELINWGGTASIHRVDDSRFDRAAAIKIPLKRFAGDERTLRRLKREAKFSGRLQHPSIVPVYDVGTTTTDAGEVPYFTMRLIQGSSLAELLATRPDPQHEQSRFIYMFRQICYAVAHAHSQGILHCDLKPENVMVGKFDDPYVMDWGFAREITGANQAAAVTAHTEDDLLSRVRGIGDDASQAVTMPLNADAAESSEAILGTPCYLPPEVARSGIGVANQRSDVFCLGGILCKILTGRPTFLGSPEEAFFISKSDDLAETQQRIKRSGADPQLISLATDCLDADLALRPANAELVAQRLSAYLQSQEDAMLNAERQARQSAVEMAKAAGDTAKAEKRSKRLWLALAFSIVVSIAVAGLSVWREANTARLERMRESDSEIARCLQEHKALSDQAASTSLESLQTIDLALATWNRSLVYLDEANSIGRMGNSDRDSIQSIVNARHQAAQKVSDLVELRRMVADFEWASELTTIVVDEHAPSKAIIRKAFQAALHNSEMEDYGQLVSKTRGLPLGIRKRLSLALDSLAFTTLGDDSKTILSHATSLVEDAPEHSMRLEFLASVDEYRQFITKWDTPSLPKSQAAYMLLCTAYMEGGRTAEAIGVIERARAMFPDSYVVHIAAANALCATSPPRYAEAEHMLRCALATLPESPILFAYLGFVNRRLGRAHLAQEWLEKALEREPEFPWALSNLGFIEIGFNGHVDKARARFQEALRLQPDYAEALDGLELTDEMGFVFSKRNKLSNSLRKPEVVALTKAISALLRNDPDAAAEGLRVSKGYYMFDGIRHSLDAYEQLLRGNLPEAEVAASQQIAIAETPFQEMIGRGVLAICHGIQGKNSQALEESRKLHRRFPDMMVTKLLLWMTLFSSGELPECRRIRSEMSDVDLRMFRIGGLAVALNMYAQALDIVGFSEAERILDASKDGNWSEFYRRCSKYDGYYIQTVAELATARGMYEHAFCAEQVYLERFPFIQRGNLMMHYLGVPSHRLNGLRAASMIHVNQVADARVSDETVRKCALQWFEAEVSAKHSSIKYPARRTHVKVWAYFCKNCPDLAGFRDAEHLAKLPDDERQQWLNLWKQVDELLEKCKALTSVSEESSTSTNVE